MKQNTIQKTVSSELCCGCGVCKGICPKECISWTKENGIYVPQIDENQCVSCGLCASVCPGLGHHYYSKANAVDTVTGEVLACYNAWSKDAELRHVSASGGVVSSVIRELLAMGLYDGAFCLDSYDYHQQLKSRLYTVEEIADEWTKSNAPKSRYLPVSHENAVVYIKENRDARLILVGTSCAIRGLQSVVKNLKLKRENYLFIGLFCDKVFNYNVLPYFEDTYTAGRSLTEVHFKNKESGGWPGDMKFFPMSSEPFYIPLAERIKAKAYFMPERCLYCVDKLNVCADISLGDNYTGKDESSLGCNSVIIRTQTGQDAWVRVNPLLEVRNVEIEDIQKAQYLEGRLNNLYFGELKAERMGNCNLNQGVPKEKNYKEYERAWVNELRKLQAGALYDTNPEKLGKQIEKDHRKPNAVVNFVKRCYYFIKRRI